MWPDYLGVIRYENLLLEETSVCVITVTKKILGQLIKKNVAGRRSGLYPAEI